jgi:hypothetical protein
MTQAIIFTVILVLVFIAGISIGGLGALKCVKFGVRASYEIRNGNQGLTKDEEDVDAEIDMLDKKEKIDMENKR